MAHLVAILQILEMFPSFERVEWLVACFDGTMDARLCVETYLPLPEKLGLGHHVGTGNERVNIDWSKGSTTCVLAVAESCGDSGKNVSGWLFSLP